MDKQTTHIIQSKVAELQSLLNAQSEMIRKMMNEHNQTRIELQRLIEIQETQQKHTTTWDKLDVLS